MAEMQGNRTPPRRFSRPTSVLKTEGCTSMPRTSAGNMSILEPSGKLQRLRSQEFLQRRGVISRNIGQENALTLPRLRLEILKKTKVIPM